MNKCLLCDFEKHQVLISKGIDYEYGIKVKANVVKCLRCGLVFQEPLPEKRKIPTFYPDNYANYATNNNPITKLLIKITERLEAKKIIGLIGKSGTILDVGCADSHYFDFIKAFGQWQFVGTDISQKAITITRKKKYKAYLGNLEGVNIPKNSITLVRMNHLIEHTYNPKTTIKKAFEILQPGGYLLLTTPNIDCPDFYIFKRYWGALHLPRHIYFFNLQTLTKLLKQEGFKIKDVNYNLMTTGWALGIQNYLQSKKRRKLINGRLKIYPFLLLIFIPILLLQKLFKMTTMFSIIAQKPIRS